MIKLISRPSEFNLDEAPVVLLPVHLTPVESGAFKESCMQLLEKNILPKNIILDFNQNTFVGCSGITDLVTLYKSARNKGIELIFKNVTPQARIVLELTQLDKVFTIELLDKSLMATSN